MQDIGFVFCPKSIGIIGASSNPDSLTNRNFLRPLLDFGYQGKIYPVNPYRSEIMGLKAYANIQDIPEPVDYVVCGVPAPLTLKLIQDCVAAKAKVITVFTAGFSETGEEEETRLEREIVEIARQGGVRIIGPNCLGIHSPKMGITFESRGSRESGHVGFLSQSGGSARELILAGAERGIYFSKVVSYGNASDLNEADFLEYFAHDKDTEIIAAYIEGIKQPQRFLEVLREATEAKPLIILKGGKTEAGAGAVLSHTGALAGSKQIWDALCRQRGVIQVRNLGEMADTTLAFSYLKPPRGRNIGIIGIGGGASVQAADDCENARLIVPPFPQEIRQELRKFTPLVGIGLRNPIDTSADVYWEPALFSKTIKLIADYDGIDVLFVMLATHMLRYGIQMLRDQIEAIIEAGKGTDKPLAIILRTTNLIEGEKIASEVQGQCFKAGFPVYPSVSRAAQATNHFISYYENRGL